MDTCTCGIQSKLTNWNSHAICSKVPQSQDPLTISDDYDTNIILRPVVQYPADTAPIFRGDVKPAGMPENVGKFPARLPDRGGVYKWCDFIYMLNSRLVKKPFVSFLQGREKNITLDVIFFPSQVAHDTGDLTLLI